MLHCKLNQPYSIVCFQRTTFCDLSDTGDDCRNLTHWIGKSHLMPILSLFVRAHIVRNEFMYY